MSQPLNREHQDQRVCRQHPLKSQAFAAPTQTKDSDIGEIRRSTETPMSR